MTDYVCTCKAGLKAPPPIPTKQHSSIYYPMIIGGIAGSMFMTWRHHLSFKMNLLSFIYDRLALFPNAAHVITEKDSNDLLQKHRMNWKMAEFLPRFEGPAMQKTLDMALPSRDEGRTIPVRVYRPKAKGLLPVILYSHGGGFSFGSIYVYDSLVREIADRSKCVLVSVDYRLSPEHKFPAGLEDCEDALVWAASSPAVLTDDMQADPSRLVICGDSAGGNFTANLAVFAKRNNIPLKLQCLLYPTTSAYCIPHWRTPAIPLPSDSAVLYSDGPMLNYSPVVWGMSLYFKSPQDAYDPRASPILYTKEDLTGVAPAFVAVAACDMLRDEGIEYAKKLAETGVQVKLRRFENTIHAFFSLHFAEHGSVAMLELADVIKSALQTKSAL